MRALVATGDAGLVELVRVPAPSPRPEEMLVDVRAFSVNRGELHRLMQAAPGWRPGWDFTGVVASDASSHVERDATSRGSVTGAGGRGSPAPGTRVFGMVAGGSWAERVAVPRVQLAVVPDEVGWAQAAALPTAALTALRMLRLAGDLSGADVLVTGAAGGVGRFAVQLARRSGARVTAVVGRPDRRQGLAALGADQVVVGTGRLEPCFDLVLESAGGDSLREALRLVAPRGTVVCFGNSSRDTVTLDVRDFYPREPTLRGFYVLNELAAAQTKDDLAFLAGLVAKGELTVDIAATADWRKAGTVLHDLRGRRLVGKAVLRVTTVEED
jgi:NADPH:quinone reductase-like Zn-dependent oxidoreductase